MGKAHYWRPAAGAAAAVILLILVLTAPPRLVAPDTDSTGTAKTPIRGASSASLLGHWSFNRTLASADRSLSFTTPQFLPRYVAGHSGDALTFPLGQGSLFAHGASLEGISLPRDNISVSFWFKPSRWEHDKAPGILFAYVPQEGPTFGIAGGQPDGRILFVQRHSPERITRLEGRIRDYNSDTWQFVVLRTSQSLGVADLYVNGEQDLTADVAQVSGGTGSLYIGTKAFNGAMDELHIFEGLLTNQEIRQLWEGRYGTPNT